MKVTMISTDFPYKNKTGTMTQGGGGTCVAQLTAGLAEKNISVSVITRSEKELSGEIVNVPVHRTKFVYLGFRESKITHSLFALPAAMNIIRRENPDIIHSHNPAAALIGIACAKVFRKPHVLTMHGPWSSVRLQNVTRSLARYIERFALRNSVAVTCDSEALTKEMKQLHGVDCMTIANAVDAHLFKPLSKTAARKSLGIDYSGPLILFTGRFVAEKGLDTLLNAAEMLISKAIDAKFLLIGGGFDEYVVSSWVAKHPEYKEHIYVIPFLNHERMNEAYRASDIFILPSLAEGLSRSLMEAMLCGLPCVATDVGGNRELIEKGRGILVEKKNPKRLAGAMEKLLKNKKLAAAIGKKASAFAKNNLVVEKRILRFISVYKSILKR